MKEEFNLKMKKGSVVIYVLALMLVTVGYWNYISNESKTIETVSSDQNVENTVDENLGDATIVSNNEVVNDNSSDVENEVTQNLDDNDDGYFEESKISRDTMYSQTL